MDCPESLEEYEELENRLNLCPKTMYLQAEARVEAGVASSRREAERQLAEETGKSESAVHRAVYRGKDLVTPVTNTNPQTESDSVGALLPDTEPQIEPDPVGPQPMISDLAGMFK